MREHPELFPWFAGIWIGLGILSFLFFQFSRSVQLKKRLLPVFIVGVGVLFSGFVLLMSGKPEIMLIVIPVVAIISFLNLRMIRVCETCGRTVYNTMMFFKMEYCSKCGAKLTKITTENKKR